LLFAGPADQLLAARRELCGGGPVRKVAHCQQSSRRADAATTESRGEDAMPLVYALGFFVVITVLVLWGSHYFGPGNPSTKQH
jgi:hypothetical protein